MGTKFKDAEIERVTRNGVYVSLLILSNKFLRGFIATTQFQHSSEAIIQNFPFVCSCLSVYKEAPADLEVLFG